MLDVKSYRLPLADAAKYTKRWREKEYAHHPHHHHHHKEKTRAFTVHLSELKAIIDELGVKTVRLYLGINDDHKETLVLVGVNEANGDMCEVQCKSDDPKITEVESGAFDFTHGCPDTCVTGYSPLNQDMIRETEDLS